MAGFDLENVMNTLGETFNGGGLQGMMTKAMKNAGFTPDQIETVMTVGEEYPALKQIDFEPLLSPDAQELRDQFLPLLEDEDLVADLATAVEGDPKVAHRINHLIKNDPDRLVEIHTQLQNEEGADITQILNGAVSEEQAKAAATASQDGGFMAGLGSLFKDFDLSEIGGNMFQGFMQLLVGVQELLMPMVETVLNSLTGLGNSGSLITEGNGHPETGPAAQARTMVMNDGNVYNAEGELTTQIHKPGSQQAPRPEDIDPSRSPDMAGPA